MASELHTADDDDYESDLGDPEAAWEAFASTLLPGTRAVLEGYGPASDFGADEPEPKPEQICLSLCELLEVIKTCLSNGGTRALSPNHHEELRGALAQALPRIFSVSSPTDMRTEVLAAADAAGLSGIERRLVVAIAESGKGQIIDLTVHLEADVLSAVKRAKKKLKRVGWSLFRKDNFVCIEAIPK